MTMRTQQHSQGDARPTSLASASALVARHRITDADLALVRDAGEVILPNLEVFLDRFYTWLGGEPEHAQFFSDRERLRRVQLQIAEYWRSFFLGRVDETYVQKRWQVGAAHARIGLSLSAYFAAVDMSLSILVDEVFPTDALGDRRSAAVRAMTKLLHLDTAIVVDTYNRQTNDRIVGQARALMEMSTPVTALGDEILMLPVVGIIDSRRAQDIMSSVLTRIADTRARVFIIDISGVSVVDTAVANYLIKVARATRLMGCRCLLSGLSPAVAQTIIELGIDVAGIETRATLRDALEEAYRAVGLQLRPIGG